MKLYGEIQHESDKTRFLTGNYNNKITFSLNTVTKEDLATIHKTIKSNVYLFGIFGLHFMKDFNDAVSHSYYGLRNEVRVERYNNGLGNIFIKGTESDVIEQNIFDYKKTQRLEKRV